MVSMQRDWNLMYESGSQQELWDGLQGSSQSGCAVGCDALGSDAGVLQWEGAAEKDSDVPVYQGGSPDKSLIRCGFVVCVSRVSSLGKGSVSVGTQAGADTEHLVQLNPAQDIPPFLN